MSAWIFPCLSTTALAAALVLYAGGQGAFDARTLAQDAGPAAEDPFFDEAPEAPAEAADGPDIRLPEGPVPAQRPADEPAVSPVPPPPPLPNAVPADPQRTEAVDPTRPSPQLQQALEAEAPPPAVAGPQAAPRVPEIRLRARMVANGVAEAILEIDGNLYRVGEGEEIMIASPRGMLMLNVLELNGDVVRLEIPPLPGKLVLR